MTTSNVMVFDIETVQRPIPESFKQGILDGKVRVDKVTKDPRKIWAKLKEKFWTQAEGSRPICVCFAHVDMRERKVEEPIGLQTDNETELAAWTMDQLKIWAPKYLVGYNSERFDLPVLEHLVRDSGDYCVPGISKWDHIDLTHKIPKFFDGWRPLKGSPVSACALFNIPHSGGSGEDVKSLHAADMEHGTRQVLKYCMEDVVATGNLFLKLNRIRSLIK